MTTEEGLDQGSPEHDAAEAAAFAAAFDAEPGDAVQEPAAAPAPAEPQTPAEQAPAPQEEAAATAPAPAAEQPAQEAAPAPTPVPESFATKEELRRLHGRIGELNDKLAKALQKEAEAKPAAAPAAVALARTAEQFPELAEQLGEDLATALAGVGGRAKPADPKEIAALVEQQVQQRLTEQRMADITDAHPTWWTDIWAQAPTAEVSGVPTPEFSAWKATLQPGVAERLFNSNSPAYVTARLAEFYDWKAKTAQAAADKTNRLKDAITPQGVARAAPPAMTDAEEERRAFSEAFNSE